MMTDGQSVTELSRLSASRKLPHERHDITSRKQRGRPSGYTPEACGEVIGLMARGLSLTAAAGAMGIGRTTVHRWMAAHEEFRDAVSRGQAARVFWLEKKLLEATSGAVVRFCCLALVNAAPEEWGRKRLATHRR